MPPTRDANTTEARARELLDKRMNSVRALSSSRQTVSDLRQQLAHAEAEDLKAYRAALADGWTPDELRHLGIDEPDKNQRPRRRATSSKATPPVNPFTPHDELVKLGAEAADEAGQR